MKNYCYTCMNEIPEGNLCPHCNRENFADQVVYRLKPGTILNKKFLVGNCLGEGGFGITYIGRDLTLDRKIAIKEYFPNGYVTRNNAVTQIVSATTDNQINFFKKGLESFLEEARKIARLNDVPGIVDVREYFEENGTGYIIMEYLDGVNLSKYLKQNGVFKPETIFTLMLPITYSLQKIHESGLIHRDISPDNIMYLRDGALKLTDFGSARYFTNSQKEMSVVLKQGYAPEEQYSKTGDQGPWTDVYGLCATMYKCITGRVPVDAIDRIKSDTLIPPRELGIEISEPMQIALMYGLAVFKNDRCKSMQELSYMMEKALANQNIKVESANYYSRVNQTMIANGVTSYRDDFDQAVNQGGRMNAYSDNRSMNTDPNYYRSNRSSYTGDNYNNFSGNYTGNYNGNYQGSYNEKPQNSKTPIIIALTIFLCVLLLAGTAIYLYLQYEKSHDNSAAVVSEATQAVLADNNDQDDADIAVTATEAPAQTSAPRTEAPRTEAPAPTAAPPTTPPVNKPTFTSADASNTLAPQRTSGGETKNYKAENVFDKDDTCWCPKEGSGVNEWIKLNLPSSTTISGIDMINGYAGNKEQYKNNGIPTSIKIEFSNGQTITKTLNVSSPDDRKKVQRVKFDPVETSYVKITILSFVPGDKCDDTCITYVAPYVE